MVTVTQAATVEDALATTWTVSSDSHVIEPPDLWQARVPEHLRDRSPRVVSEDAGDFWYVEGRRSLSFLGIQTGDRFVKRADQLRSVAKVADVRPAAFDPAAYLAENEADGIWACVLYPSLGLIIVRTGVPDLMSASCRAYNDWLADFCSHDRSRLKGVAMVNVDDPNEGAAELARSRELGLAGAMITLAPPEARPFTDPAYDRFWAAAQDLSMPISLHTATDRVDPAGRDSVATRHVAQQALVNKDAPVRQTLLDLIFSGVFERFPRLRVGSVEHELAWIPFFLAQADFTYRHRPSYAAPVVFSDDLAPSDFWRRNCFASFQEDAVGIRERDVIGVSTLMWGSDYPHTESTYPRSQQILSEILAGVSTEDVVRITSANAAALYGFDVPERA
jgi:predicted TIM-barrel fold metal-dependent hydrolase